MRNFMTRWLVPHHRRPRAARGACLIMLLAILAAALLTPWTAADAQALRLLVQPPAWAPVDRAVDARPLARLLSAALGVQVEPVVPADALSHWHAVRRGRGHDMALEEAHFTDFRIQRHDFEALAQDSRPARFAVVVTPGTLVTGPGDLAGREVATAAPPSLAALRLLELFLEPARMPVLVSVRSTDAAIRALSRGKVSAALVPYAERERLVAVSVVLVTDASPGRGFAVSPTLGPDQRRTLLRVLTGAGNSAEGRRALDGLGLRGFQPASNSVFEGTERLLRGTWGYH